MSSTESEEHPLAIAVVLTWKDTEMAARCIESVYANNYPNKKCIIVDNGSDPPGCPILCEQFPDLEPVQLDKNYGFTGGCNRGMERAIELGADYVFMLNNDTIIHENAITELVNAMEAEPRCGMATPIILFPGEEKRIQFFTGTMDRDVARHVHPGENNMMTDEHRRTVETEFAPAVAPMYRAETLREVGMFDERLFTNWEDYDLVCRMQDADWKFFSVGTAEIIHAHGQTTGRISPFITYLFTRNRLMCLFRYGRPMGILRKFPFYLRTCYWQIRNYGFDNWPAHRAFIKGVFDFLMGIEGGDSVPKTTSDKKK